MSTWKIAFERFRQTRFYRPLMWFSGILLFVGLMDNIVMPLYVKLGNEKELPDVLEMTVQEATKSLEQKGFQIIVKDSLYDARHAAETVIEQNPYPYATVKEGRRVYLTVSIGEKPITMPKLFSLSPRDAELILKSNNLELHAQNYVFSDIYPEGIVIGQSYPQGQEIAAGSKIDITISLGKLKEDRSVPELIGKSLQESRERLKSLGIRIGSISYEERENILPETVIEQSVPAGTKVEGDLTISLVVSKEKTF